MDGGSSGCGSGCGSGLLGVTYNNIPQVHMLLYYVDVCLHICMGACVPARQSRLI